MPIKTILFERGNGRVGGEEILSLTATKSTPPTSHTSFWVVTKSEVKSVPRFNYYFSRSGLPSLTHPEDTTHKQQKKTDRGNDTPIPSPPYMKALKNKNENNRVFRRPHN